MSSWADIVSIKSNKPTKSFKEGVDYARNSEPIDIFHRELKELEPLMDKGFQIEVTLLSEDMSNPYEKQYLSIETIFGVDGEVMYKNETYNKVVSAKDIISYILNERTFYTNSYSDADRLHLMLYKFLKKIENYNNSLGVRPIGNTNVVEQIREYVLRLEQDKAFIVASRINEAKKESGTFSFFKNRESQILERQETRSTGGMAGVMNNRASRFDLGNRTNNGIDVQTTNGRVFMK